MEAKTTERQTDNSEPTPVDLNVGERIRIRRKLLGLSQETLARSLGLTFQQVQKYERGTNRISASKPFQTACTLQVSVSYFFDGLEEDGHAEVSEDESTVHAFLATAEGVELAASFLLIASPGVRRRVLNW